MLLSSPAGNHVSVKKRASLKCFAPFKGTKGAEERS